MEVTFDKSAAEFIMDAFPDITRECGVCSDEITAENLAGVVNNVGFVCKDFACLMSVSDVLYLNETWQRDNNKGASGYSTQGLKCGAEVLPVDKVEE